MAVTAGLPGASIFATIYGKDTAAKGAMGQDDRADEMGRKGNEGRDWKTEDEPRRWPNTSGLSLSTHSGRIAVRMTPQPKLVKAVSKGTEAVSMRGSNGAVPEVANNAMNGRILRRAEWLSDRCVGHATHRRHAGTDGGWAGGATDQRQCQRYRRGDRSGLCCPRCAGRLH